MIWLTLSEKLKGEKFELKKLGSLEDLSAYNKKERAAHPEGENAIVCIMAAISICTQYVYSTSSQT